MLIINLLCGYQTIKSPRFFAGMRESPSLTIFPLMLSRPRLVVQLAANWTKSWDFGKTEFPD
jgi:hypothetical protein